MCQLHLFIVYFIIKVKYKQANIFSNVINSDQTWQWILIHLLVISCFQSLLQPIIYEFDVKLADQKLYDNVYLTRWQTSP